MMKITQKTKMMKRTQPIEWGALAVSCMLSFTNLAFAQTLPDYGIENVPAKGREYSPYLDRGYPEKILWGDTHLHTGWSTDAGFMGAITGPEEAYRFARGEEVVSSHGVRAKLVRPYDWLVVADHAENLGLAPMARAKDPALIRLPFGKKMADLLEAGKLDEAYAEWLTAVNDGEDPLDDDKLRGSAWERMTGYAKQYNQPGVFTAFIGFEWTSNPGGNNLHRNVIYRDGKDKADRVLPFSNFDSSDPEDLWKWMEGYEQKTGGQLLALAHNGNLSNGLMFDDQTLSGKPLSRDYAERRMRWEPMYEVTQMKGDSEAHPMLSQSDEFANYGTWDVGSFGAAKDPGMIDREYAREAFKRGLVYEEKLGVNPFKFGLVGSTDSHTGLSTAREDNFFGKVSKFEPYLIDGKHNEERYTDKVTGRVPDPKGRNFDTFHSQTLAAGLAAVWATENTREAIWDAMKRKEVYASTGTRISVRVFAGWDFTEEDVQRPDFAKTGYRNGVPMGGDLSKAPKGKAPVLLVRTLRDPDGANLDRIQIIKGWADKDGKTHEKVYDVAVSDGREIGEDGRCKQAVGNTVDVKTAQYTNSIGDALLMGYWKDPEFDAGQRAFYYVRVLEIPTPRWTTYDAVHFGTELPENVPATHQERAYTSPIWYTP